MVDKLCTNSCFSLKKASHCRSLGRWLAPTKLVERSWCLVTLTIIQNCFWKTENDALCALTIFHTDFEHKNADLNNVDALEGQFCVLSAPSPEKDFQLF